MIIRNIYNIQGISSISNSALSELVYTTLNPFDKSANITLSGDDLIAQSTNASVDYQVRSILTIGAAEKKQVECTFVRVNPTDPFFVIGGLSRATESVDAYTGFTDGCSITTDGDNYKNGVYNPAGWGAWTDGEIATFAYDGPNGTLYVYRNGSLLGTITGLSGVYHFGTGTYQTLGTTTVNFGATAFSYPQSGYTGMFN